MAEPRRVAVLGTGIMGAPIARNLHDAGFDITVWNRTRAKAEGLGATVADDPAAVVRDADVVVTMLSDVDAVLGTMRDGGALDALSDDAIWLQMSTIGLDGNETAARAAAERGIAYVDAPVLGSKQPAEAGELVVLASGPKDALDALEPLFDVIGKKTLRLGDAGEGSRLKLVVNAWIVSMVESLAETIGFAQKIGIDPETFLATIDGAPMGAPYAQVKGKTMIERQFPPSFPLKLALKDAELVLEAAEGLDLPVAKAAAAQFRRSVELGHGDEDMAAVYEAVAHDLEEK